MDEKKRVIEALSAHADELVGHPVATKQIDLTDGEHKDLASLLQLSDQLQRSMKPVQPSPTFVQSLRNELETDAKRHMALRKRMGRIAMIGAAAVGSIVSIASVVGAVVMLVKWLRTRTQARHAATG